MLSRIAESVFWIGRYVERADDTARILDVHLQLMLEDPWIDENTACRSLLDLMGAPAADPAASITKADVLSLLAIDPDSPSSIVYSLRAARENARRAREIVSVELWETLNTTSSRLPRNLDVENAHRFFQWVHERIALASGVTDDSTSRDDVWRFLALGRAIERIDITARLLSARTLVSSTASWTTILRSCGAYDAFLRTYRGASKTSDAAEFLLLDRLFPRSMLYTIRRAEEHMEAIDPATDRIGHTNNVLRALGRIRSDLEYRRLDELLDGLPARMEQVQLVVDEAYGAIRDRFFPTHAEPSWIGEIS